MMTNFDEFSICPYTAAVVILDKMNQALAFAAYTKNKFDIA